MAAELLWIALDQLEVAGTPAERLPVSQQRLTAQVESLDSSLTKLRLSPFPALVVALEGDTEMCIVPKVFEFLGMRQDANWIVLENLGSADANPRLLARYAARPKLGKDLGEYVTLERPVTRFLVVTDAENKHKQEKNREKWSQRLLDCVVGEIPLNLQSDLRRPNSELVGISTWGDLPFEFTHFSDAELAAALLHTSSRVYEGNLEDLTAAVARQRAAESPDIQKAWRPSGIKKPELAEAMWPLLRSKIERSLELRDSSVPVLQVVLRMDELARKDSGKLVALKKA